MKKKWIAVVLAISMVLNATVPVMAAETENNLDALSQESKESLPEENQEEEAGQRDSEISETDTTEEASQEESALQQEESADQKAEKSLSEEENPKENMEQPDFETEEMDTKEDENRDESVLQQETDIENEEDSFIEGDTFSEGALTYRVLGGETSCEVIGCDKSYEGNIEIPQSIKGFRVVRIYYYAFKNASVEKIKIPDSVVWIGGGAFSGSKIKLVELPENLSEINF